MFIGCFAFGVFYSIMSLILGGHDSDHGFDHGVNLDHGIDPGFGADLDQGIDIGHGVELSQGAEVHHGTDSSVSPSPFSPLVIASGITAFGAIGLISMLGFGMSGLVSAIVALGFAGAIGAAIFFGIVKFMYGSQSNSIFSLDEVINTEAEIITPVPEKGLGEIAYTANGIRYTMPARSMDGQGINRGARVIIRDIAGNVAVVQQKITLDDIDFYRNTNKKENREKPRSDAG